MVHKYFTEASENRSVIDKAVQEIYDNIDGVHSTVGFSDNDGKSFSVVYSGLFLPQSKKDYGKNVESFLNAISSCFAYEPEFNHKSVKIKNGLKTLFEDYRDEDNVHAFQFWVYLVEMFEFAKRADQPSGGYSIFNLMKRFKIEETRAVIIGDDSFPVEICECTKRNTERCSIRKFLDSLNADLKWVDDKMRTESIIKLLQETIKILEDDKLEAELKQTISEEMMKPLEMDKLKKKLEKLKEDMEMATLAITEKEMKSMKYEDWFLDGLLNQKVLLMNSMITIGVKDEDKAKCRNDLTYFSQFCVNYLRKLFTELAFIFIGETAEGIVDDFEIEKNHLLLKWKDFNQECPSKPYNAFAEINLYFSERDKKLIDWSTASSSKVNQGTQIRNKTWREVLPILRYDRFPERSPDPQFKQEWMNKKAHQRFIKGANYKDRNGYIYVYKLKTPQTEEDKKICKIGKSINPARRVAGSEKHNQEKYELVKEFHTPYYGWTEEIIKAQLMEFKTPRKVHIDGKTEWYTENGDNNLKFFIGVIENVMRDVNACNPKFVQGR